MGYTYKWGIPWGYKPLIRSPLIRSLPTGHPSGGVNTETNLGEDSVNILYLLEWNVRK